jgi:hypothetical protein
LAGPLRCLHCVGPLQAVVQVVEPVLVLVLHVLRQLALNLVVLDRLVGTLVSRSESVFLLLLRLEFLGLGLGDFLVGERAARLATGVRGVRKPVLGMGIAAARTALLTFRERLWKTLAKNIGADLWDPIHSAVCTWPSPAYERASEACPHPILRHRR